MHTHIRIWAYMWMWKYMYIYVCIYLKYVFEHTDTVLFLRVNCIFSACAHVLHYPACLFVGGSAVPVQPWVQDIRTMKEGGFLSVCSDTVRGSILEGSHGIHFLSRSLFWFWWLWWGKSCRHVCVISAKNYHF